MLVMIYNSNTSTIIITKLGSVGYSSQRSSQDSNVIGYSTIDTEQRMKP